MKSAVTILAVALLVCFGSDARAAGPTQAVQKRGLAEKDASSEPGTGPTLRKTAPTPQIGPVQEPRIIRERNPTATPSRQTGRGAAAQPRNPGLAALDCAPGFAREIKPDQPGGFYVCRLPAKPPCTAGYEHKTIDHDPQRFQYRCYDDMAEYVDGWAGEGKPQVCAQGWTLSSPGGDYDCSSSPLQCKFGHRLDGTAADPIGHWPHQEVIYAYRCRAN